MKSFGTVHKLDEKVSKKEISDGLNDSNVRIGIEYEFIFKEESIIDEEAQVAYKEYIHLRANISQARINASDARAKYDDQIQYNVGNTKNTFWQQMEVLKKKVKKMEQGTPEFIETWNEINKYTDWYYELEELETHMTDDILDANVDFDYVDEMPEMYAWEEDDIIEFPDIGDKQKYGNYIDWLENYRGLRLDYTEINRNFIDYIFDYGGMELNEVLMDNELEEPETGEIGDYPGDYGWQTLFETRFEDNKYLPFEPYRASYHNPDESRNHRLWSVGSDTSLPIYGCEIVSPVLSTKQTSETLQGMFKFIHTKGFTNEKCGLHVNMSYKGKKFKDFDSLKVMLFMEEDLVYKLFQDRKYSAHAKALLQPIKDRVVLIPNHLDAVPMKKMFSDFRKLIVAPIDKYFGINIKNTIEGTASDRVEFRYMGGKNYHYKSDFVLAQIGRYAHYLRLGFDPSYKKDEYTKKLTRLYNEFYEKDPSKMNVYDDKTRKLVLKRGQFMGTTKNGMHVYLFRGMYYYIYTSYGDYEIVSIKTPMKAKKEAPFVSKSEIKSFKRFSEFIDVMSVKLTDYQKQDYKVYRSISDKKVIYIMPTEESIAILKSDEYQMKGNKVILR